MLGYAFGDNEIARRRLTLLAEVSNPSSHSFLLEHAPSGASPSTSGAGLAQPPGW